MRTIEGELARLEAYRHKEPWNSSKVDVNALDWRDTVVSTGYPAALRALAAIKKAATIMPEAGDTRYMRSVVERFERGEFD
jgi:hypothetical protein